MGEIAQYLKVELPTTTTLIDKLVKATLLERKPDDKDRRIVRVILTPSGEKLLSDSQAERARKMKEILSHLSEKESDDLSHILQTLLKKMEDTNEK